MFFGPVLKVGALRSKPTQSITFGRQRGGIVKYSTLFGVLLGAKVLKIGESSGFAIYELRITNYEF